eukprot:COSAG02_NODE_20600_length_823_cov_1.567680_2_plen_83_part_01
MSSAQLPPKKKRRSLWGDASPTSSSSSTDQAAAAAAIAAAEKQREIDVCTLSLPPFFSPSPSLFFSVFLSLFSLPSLSQFIFF